MCDHSSSKSVLKRILELDRKDNDVIPAKMLKKSTAAVVALAKKNMSEKLPLIVRTRRVVTKVTKITTMCECNYTVTYQKYLYNGGGEGSNSSVRPISSTTKNYNKKTPTTVHTKRVLEIVERL